jgi:hypothetical protein
LWYGRAISSLFESLGEEGLKPLDDEEDEDLPSEWVIMVSFLQIYQETIQDLLSPWALEVSGGWTGCFAIMTT